MNLDFSGLNGLASGKKKEPDKSPTRAVEEPVKEDLEEATLDTLKGLLEAVSKPKEPVRQEVEGVALINLTQKQEDHKRLEKAYKEYQDNIRRAGNLRAEILKGLKNGESQTDLFLKAVECISVMTGDTLFYDQIKKLL